MGAARQRHICGLNRHMGKIFLDGKRIDPQQTGRFRINLKLFFGVPCL
jgi:hypothetical protein